MAPLNQRRACRSESLTKLMHKSIYSGLTSEQSFNVMQATVQCHQELPKLEKWSKQTHFKVGVSASSVVSVAAYLQTSTQALVSVWSSLGVAAAVGAFVMLVTWYTARRTERRRDFMRALNQGLHQLKGVAACRPGASAAELIHAMTTTGAGNSNE